jgi:hypothetical protein
MREASASVAASPALRREDQCLGHPQLEHLNVLFPSTDLGHQTEEISLDAPLGI